MTKTMIVLALSMLGLAGCAPLDRSPGVCKDRTIVLNYARGSIGVSPNDYQVDLCPGYSLRVKLVGPGIRPGGARTEEKAVENPQPARWLNQSTADGNFIVIQVPESGVLPGEAYGYDIYVDGVGMLDPVIRIIRD